MDLDYFISKSGLNGQAMFSNIWCKASKQPTGIKNESNEQDRFSSGVKQYYPSKVDSAELYFLH